MLNLAQKVYLASLARKEAAMPWEDEDSSTMPEILAGVGGAATGAGAVYGPGLLRKGMRLNKDMANQLYLGSHMNQKDLYKYQRALSGDAKKAKRAVKDALGLAKVDKKAKMADASLKRALKALGIKGKGGRAAAAATLAALLGGNAAGIAHLLDN